MYAITAITIKFLSPSDPFHLDSINYTVTDFAWSAQSTDNKQTEYDNILFYTKASLFTFMQCTNDFKNQES